MIKEHTVINPGEEVDPKEYVDWEYSPSLVKNVQRDSDDKFKLKVIKKHAVNHDSYLFELEFPNKDWISGLWPSGHLIFHKKIGDEDIARKYTPVSPINKKGSADFIVKIYRKHPDFENKGKFTQYLENEVNVGDEIVCSGPVGRCKYLGDGIFHTKGPLGHKKTKLGLIAGGSGITPMYSIAQAAIYANDGLEIVFLYSNKTKDDMLCLDELNELAAMNP